MPLLSVLRLRLRSVFFRRRVEQELDEELQYHLDREEQRCIEAGMSADDAHYSALRSVEGVEQRKEECRDMRGLVSLDNITQDFRYALRQLQKNRGFACTAIFVLALGIAATVASFGSWKQR